MRARHFIDQQGMKHRFRRPTLDRFLATAGCTSSERHSQCSFRHVRGQSVRGHVLKRSGRFAVLFMVLLLLTCILSSQADEPPQPERREPTQQPQDEPTQQPPDEAPQQPPDEPEPTQQPPDDVPQQPQDEPTQQPPDEAPQQPPDEPTQQPPDEDPQPSPDPTNEPEVTPEPTDEPTREPAQDPTEDPTQSPMMESTPNPVSTPPPTPPPTPRPTLNPTSLSTPSTSPPPETPPITPAPASDYPPAAASPSSTPRPTPQPTTDAKIDTDFNTTSNPVDTDSDTTSNPIDTDSNTTSDPANGPSTTSTPAQPSTPSSTSPQSPSPPNTMDLPGTGLPTSWPMEPADRTTAAPSNQVLASPTPTSSFPILGYKAFNATMILTGSNIEPLDSDAEALWEAITKDTIAAEIREVIGAETIQKLEVVVTLVSQNPQLNQTSSMSRDSRSGANVVRHDHSSVRQRSLQEKEQELQFDTVVVIQSVLSNHDINRYIVGAFNEDSEETQYIVDLISTGHLAFLSIQSVSVSPATSIASLSDWEDEIPQAEQGDSNRQRARFTTGIVLSSLIAVGIAAVAFLVHRRRSKVAESAPISSQFERNRDEDGEKGVGSEIEVGTRADVSSLGDPFPQEMTDDDDDDVAKTIGNKSKSSSNVSFITLDYDYQLALRRPHPPEADSQADGQPSSLVSKDDNTLEAEYGTVEPFEVNAPAGRLGLVLQTAGGVPVVQIVMDESPLAGIVHAGDLLLSVDGTDVLTMKTKHVSRLIASENVNSMRRFVFGRPPERSFDAPTDDE